MIHPTGSCCTPTRLNRVALEYSYIPPLDQLPRGLQVARWLSEFQLSRAVSKTSSLRLTIQTAW
jgi:hypothetical protein